MQPARPVRKAKVTAAAKITEQLNQQQLVQLPAPRGRKRAAESDYCDEEPADLAGHGPAKARKLNDCRPRNHAAIQQAQVPVKAIRQQQHTNLVSKNPPAKPAADKEFHEDTDYPDPVPVKVC